MKQEQIFCSGPLSKNEKFTILMSVDEPSRRDIEFMITILQIYREHMPWSRDMVAKDIGVGRPAPVSESVKGDL